MKLVHWYREGRVFLFPPFGQNINKSNFNEKGGQREGRGSERGVVGRGGEKRGGAGRGKGELPPPASVFPPLKLFHVTQSDFPRNVASTRNGGGII